MDTGAARSQLCSSQEFAISLPRPSFSATNCRPSEVFDSVIKNRKGWKSHKDGERVWPPELEAALLEALEKYVPRNTREPRSLGRCPLRNRFISDYIYQKTGKKRTTKQVGSRIQQLRDTCAGKKLLELLCQYVPSKRPSSFPAPGLKTSELTPGCRTDVSNDVCSSSSSDTSLDSPTGSSDLGFQSDEQLLQGGCLQPDVVNVVHVNLVVPQNDLSFLDEAESARQVLPPFMSNYQGHINHVQISQQPRHLCDIDPTITFLSQSTVFAHCVFRVRMNGVLVFTEQTALVPDDCSGNRSDDIYSPRLYRSLLVPGYWERICNSDNPTQFTIEQEVQLDYAEELARPLFRAVYKFRFTPNPSVPCTDNEGPCPGYPHSLDPRIARNDYCSSLAPGNPVFMDPSLEALSQCIDLDDVALLAELDLLNPKSPTFVTESPDARSNTSFLPSPSSLRRYSMSPMGSGTSESSSSFSSNTPSPMLYPGAIPMTPLIIDLLPSPVEENGPGLGAGYSFEDLIDVNAVV